MTSTDRHTVIIGGGLSGLAAARNLARAGRRVTLLESAPVAGGLASSLRLKGETVEHFYHFICRHDDFLVNLVQEMGLSSDLHWRHTNTSFFHAGRLYRFGSPIDLMRFTAVPFLQRLRFGWHVTRSSLRSNWRWLDELPARAWLIENIGEEAYNVIWHPLLRIKFGDYYDRISAAWVWHRIWRVARSRKGRLNRSVFGYLTHGSETLIRALVEWLRVQPNVTLKTDVRVKAIDIQGDVVRGVHLESERLPCSSLISTVALPVLDRLVPGQSSPYFDRVRQIQYIGVICGLFSLKHRFTTNFWLNINDPRISFNGVIEQTNLNQNLRNAGLNLLYVPYYLATSEPRYRFSDQQLYDEYVPMLKLVNPRFDESWIEDFFVSRAAHAQAVCTTHFAHLRPDHRTPVRGLYVTDSTQFYPEDRTLSAAIEQGQKAAALCLEDDRSV
jgi:protoporphyrinogen oxidase